MTDENAEVSVESTVVEDQADKTEVPESVEAPTEDAVSETTETKPQTRFDKRIGQLTGEKYALREDRDYWREKALSREQAPKVQPEESPERPKLADFDHDIEAYAEALAEFTSKSIDFAKKEAVTEITATAKDVTAEQTQNDLQTQRQTRFSEKSTEFSQENPDFFDVISNPTLNITESMTDVIMELEKGPEVVYHLGNHPEVAHRIANQSPVVAAIELSKIENSLGQKVASPTSSNAPEPPNPISGSRGSATKDPQDMTDKEFRDWRNKQIKAR